MHQWPRTKCLHRQCRNRKWNHLRVHSINSNDSIPSFPLPIACVHAARIGVLCSSLWECECDCVYVWKRWCLHLLGPNVAAATKKPTRIRHTRSKCAFSFHLLTITTDRERYNCEKRQHQYKQLARHCTVMSGGCCYRCRCRRCKLKMNLNLLSLVFCSRHSLHVSSIL